MTDDELFDGSVGDIPAKGVELVPSCDLEAFLVRAIAAENRLACQVSQEDRERIAGIVGKPKNLPMTRAMKRLVDATQN